MKILKTVRLVTMVSFAVASAWIVGARQANAQTDIGYRPEPYGAAMQRAPADRGWNLGEKHIPLRQMAMICNAEWWLIDGDSGGCGV
jgi:hypothetical protein